MRTGERLRFEGWKEGYQAEAAQATQRALRNVVHVRFGAPPEWFEAKILAADTKTLHHWITLAAAAPTLDAVFTPLSPAG